MPSKRVWGGVFIVGILLSGVLTALSALGLPRWVWAVICGCCVAGLFVVLGWHPDFGFLSKRETSAVPSQPWIAAKKLDNNGLSSGPGQIASDDLTNDGVIQSGPGLFMDKNEVIRGNPAGTGTAISIEGSAQGISLIGNKFIGFDKIVEVKKSPPEDEDKE
jgi:hypothetical protein